MTDLKDYLQKFSGEKTLMTIYPHPDDETMAAGGFLLQAKELGWKTIVVCLTKGGAGKILVNPKGKSIKEVREAELMKAAKRLGASEVILGDFPDGELRETRDKWFPWVLDLMEKYKPGVIVTYDRSGTTGHPDHIALSIGLAEILLKVKVRPKVFWTSLPEWLRNKMIPESLWEYASVPAFELNLGRQVVKKWLAARSHRSQPSVAEGFWPIPLLGLFLINPREWYYEVGLEKEYPHKYIEFKI